MTNDVKDRVVRKIRMSEGEQFAWKMMKVTSALVVVSIVIIGDWMTATKQKPIAMMTGLGPFVNHTFEADRFFPIKVQSNLKDVRTGVPMYQRNKGDVALFWNIPNSGPVIQCIMTGCQELILAGHKGVPKGETGEVSYIILYCIVCVVWVIGREFNGLCVCVCVCFIIFCCVV